jgi:hypothetical protein
MVLLFAFLKSFVPFIICSIICSTIVIVVSKGKMDISSLAGFIFGMSITVIIFAIIGALIGLIIGFFAKGLLVIARDYADARRDPQGGPAKVNLSALLQLRYLLLIVSLSGVFVFGYIAYDRWKTHKEYLSVDKSAMEYARSDYVKGRMDLHLRFRFDGLASFPELARGHCSCSGLGDFLRRLTDSRDMNYEDIVACAVKYNQPSIIKPFFEWYDVHSEDKKYFSTRSMSELFVLMKKDALSHIEDVFKQSENPKILSICVRILSDIGSKEAISIMSNSIINTSGFSCYASANAIEAIVVSDFVEKEKAFEIIKAVYGLEDPELRVKAMEALRYFRGKGPLELLGKGLNDGDNEVREASQKIIKLYNKE